MPISPQERKYHNTHNRNITQAEARIDGAFAEVVQGVTRIYQLYDFTLPEGGAFLLPASVFITTWVMVSTFAIVALFGWFVV